MGSVDVAYGDDLRAGFVEECAHVAGALAAGADAGDRDAFAGRGLDASAEYACVDY